MIASVLVAGSVCLMAWLIYRTARRPMPGYAIPILIGISLIGYGIYSEYSWKSRTLAQLPDRFVTVHSIEGNSPFSPWAYLVPRVDQVSVFDPAGVREHDSMPGVALVELAVLRRLHPTLKLRLLVDCVRGRRADLSSTTRFDADTGIPEGLEWRSLDADHRLLTAVCQSLDS